MLPMLTIAPRVRRKCGAAARAQRKAPRTLTDSTVSHNSSSSSVARSLFATAGLTAALFTNRSSRPCSTTALCTMASTARRSRTSARSARALAAARRSCGQRQRLGHRGCRFALRTAERQQHVRAAPNQLEHDRRPDAGSTTRHDRYFALHGISSPNRAVFSTHREYGALAAF